jgi:hypothetical protein
LQGAAREKTSSASHFEIFREHSEHAGMKPRNAGETEVGSHEETEHSQEKTETANHGEKAEAANHEEKVLDPMRASC